MHVPHAVNIILHAVTPRNVSEDGLLQHIRDLNIFQVKSAEAQIRTTGVMPNTWWVDGRSLPEGYDCQSIGEMVQEAELFFPTVQVTQSNPYFVFVHQIPGWHGWPPTVIQHGENAT